MVEILVLAIIQLMMTILTKLLTPKLIEPKYPEIREPPEHLYQIMREIDRDCDIIDEEIATRDKEQGLRGIHGLDQRGSFEDASTSHDLRRSGDERTPDTARTGTMGEDQNDQT